MKSDYGKKARSTGVGPSKVFAVDTPEAQAVRDRLLACHLNGKLISELLAENLIDEILLGSVISYHVTDEGIEERNEGRTGHGVRVGPSPEERDIDRFKRNATHQEQARNVAADRPAPARTIKADGLIDWTGQLRDTLAERHREPGERVHWLSPNKCAKDGTRGWVPKYDMAGEEIRWGNMVLASMPEDVAREREKAMEDKGAQNLRSSVQRTREQQGQLLDTVGAGGLNPESRGDVGLLIERSDGTRETL